MVTSAFLWEKVKKVDFSESIAACDLKDGTCRQLIELKKVSEYRRSRSFLDLGPWSFINLKMKTGFSQVPLGHFEPNFACKFSGTGK